MRFGPTNSLDRRAEDIHRVVDDLDAQLGVRRADALLLEPARVARGQLRRGQGMQPPVVVGGDEVQGAAVQPGDKQRPTVGERVVDVGCAEARRAAADAQPRAARILPLDRQQPADDLFGTAGRRTAELLGREPRGGDRRHRTCREVTLRASNAA
jgi:hypothetical protein